MSTLTITAAPTERAAEAKLSSAEFTHDGLRLRFNPRRRHTPDTNALGFVLHDGRWLPVVGDPHSALGYPREALLVDARRTIAAYRLAKAILD